METKKPNDYRIFFYIICAITIIGEGCIFYIDKNYLHLAVIAWIIIAVLNAESYYRTKDVLYDMWDEMDRLYFELQENEKDNQSDTTHS